MAVYPTCPFCKRAEDDTHERYLVNFGSYIVWECRTPSWVKQWWRSLWRK